MRVLLCWAMGGRRGVRGAVVCCIVRLPTCARVDAEYGQHKIVICTYNLHTYLLGPFSARGRVEQKQKKIKLSLCGVYGCAGHRRVLYRLCQRITPVAGGVGVEPVSVLALFHVVVSL